MKAQKNKTDLQKEGYKKTSILGLYVHKSKGFYNYTTQNVLKPTKRGYITVNKVLYNCAKVLLNTFSSIEPRNGQITYLDNDKTNVTFDNVKYTTEIAEQRPNKEDLKTFINLYIYLDKPINLTNPIIKIYIKIIADKRAFFELIDIDREVFKEWLTITNSKNTFYELSKRYNTATLNIQTSIYKCLNTLIKESFADKANGILKQVEKPIKMTKSSELKKLNRLLNGLETITS